MADLDPTVLRRMLALRQFPLFGDAELGELAVIAENVTESTLAAESIVAEAASPLQRIHLIVEGRIEAAAPGGRIDAWHAHDVCGVLEVLAGRSPAATMIAPIETRSFVIGAEDFLELLADNFGILASMMRALAARVALDLAPAPPAVLANASPFGLVERLMLFRRQPPLARARLQALAMLAQTSQIVTWPAGTVVARAGEPAAGVLLIIEGDLQATRGDLTCHALGPGHAIGLLETVGGLNHGFTVEATSPVRALESTGTALYDVLEDHTDLGLTIGASLAASLLDDLAEGDALHATGN